MRLKEDGTSATNQVFHINQAAAEGNHITATDPPFIDHMYLDDTSQPGQEWLFGTTRSRLKTTTGDFVYYWKVRLNPTTHDPDSTTLVCIRA